MPLLIYFKCYRVEMVNLSLFTTALRIGKITYKKAGKIAYLSFLKRETAPRVRLKKKFQLHLSINSFHSLLKKNSKYQVEKP